MTQENQFSLEIDSLETNNYLMKLFRGNISLSYIYERLLYSTGKSRKWANRPKSPPPPPPFLPFGEILDSYRGTWRNFTHRYFMHHWTSLWFLWQKSPPPLWFLWQKSPPPPGWGKIFWPQIYPFLAISSNFGFCGRKAPPPLPFGWGKIFWPQIYPFLAISSNFGFCGRKAPPPQDEGKFFDLRFIRFWEFRATLVFVAEKPPPQGWGKIFWPQIYPFLAISSNFGFCGRKAPPPLRFIRFWQFRATLVFVAEKPPPPRMRENFLTSDLSVSGNFEQLWFLWQKSPPPHDI